jgi:hypothetical protein
MGTACTAEATKGVQSAMLIISLLISLAIICTAFALHFTDSCLILWGADQNEFTEEPHQTCYNELYNRMRTGNNNYG